MNKFTELMKLMEEEEPEYADAIIWLQGDKLDRMEKVVELYEGGFAHNLIISGNNVNRDYPDFISLESMVEGALASFIPTSPCIFVDPGANNTYEHPDGVLGIAREFGWKRLLLVTSLYHQPRAFLSFLMHVKNETIINQPWKGVSFREGEYQGGKGGLRTLMRHELNKVDRGVEMKMLASIEEGIDYINNRKQGKE